MAKVEVPWEVFEGLEAIRKSGQVNMLDRLGVQWVANQLGYYATFIWLDIHHKEYAEGVSRGFKPVPDSTPTPTIDREIPREAIRLPEEGDQK